MAATIPVSGTRPLLVILVEASDVAPAASHTQAFFETAFFGTRPSVVDFYTEVSYGDFTYTQADTLGWYTSPYTRADIHGSKTYDAVRWGIQQADATVNYATYDTNGDGTVTNEELTIYVITTGTGEDAGGNPPAVWAHHWWAGSVTCDGKTVEGEYSITSEMNPIGTFCHELGHDLGLPDLYDTTPDPVDSEGIGEFGLMGSGSWCGPTQMTAWEKTQLGWMTPTVVPANGFYNIRDSETHDEAYILRNAAHGTDEYFMVENRWRGTSYDSLSGPNGRLDDEGLAIYHIDESRAAGWWSSADNRINGDETHKAVDVECADSATSHVLNADHLDRLANRGDANDLWDNGEYDFSDTSTPCAATWYGGGASGLGVLLIPAPGATMRTYLRITPNLPPTAVPGGPYTGVEGTAIAFDGSGSSDPDGDPLTYSWGFGDGSTGTGPTPTHVYADEGVYTVTLTVTDPFGLAGTASTTATVGNVAPVIDPIGDIASLDEGTAFTVSGSFTDPGNDVWTGTVDHGDGGGVQPLILVGKTFTLSHSYCDNGVYTVTVTISDDDGGVDTEDFTVTVNNVAPVVQMTPIPAVNEGDTVQFTATASDPGTCDTLTYAWTFGDGGTATGTLTPTHAYGDNGDYLVTVTATDDDGASTSVTITVTANNVAPIVAKGAMDQPDPFFVLPVVHTLTFHATFSDPGWLDIHTALWDFGDGTSVGELTEDNLPPDATGTVTGTHAFSAPGDYSVTVTVTDDDGGATTSAAWSVHVADAAEAKHILDAYIQALPNSAFKNNPQQRRNSFSNVFRALDDMLEDQEWNGFATSIVSDVRAKADGQVDGKPNDDWITAKAAQQDICMMIDDIVAYVRTMI